MGTYALNVNTGRAQVSAGYAAIHGLPGILKSTGAMNGWPVCIPMIARGLMNFATKPLPSDGASIRRSIAFFVRAAKFGGSKRAP